MFNVPIVLIWKKIHVEGGMKNETATLENKCDLDGR
ncbi:MAG: hypothetical protein KatS3mg080_1065 [Anoxybacillus sp.]|nr:hypothetical protein F510_0778 [Anoxybacillus gonensis]GIW50454.1 MAG: hypothetical protein KatS3mg080_1065 [Anoxybacillus sp.]